MIQTLGDLVAHMKREAERHPDLAEEILLRSPGVPSEEIARLHAAVPGLPTDYLALLQRFALDRVVIGYFRFSPTAFAGIGQIARLLAANSARNPLWPLLVSHRLFEVGAYEGDPLCVASIDAPQPGEVIRVDVSAPLEPSLHRTAWNFEQILLGAGRIDELRAAGARGPVAVEELLRGLGDDFGLDGDHLADWRWFAEVALLD